MRARILAFLVLALTIATVLFFRPHIRFRGATGLDLPFSAEVLAFTERSSGPEGPRSLVLIARVEEDQAERILADEPPWGGCGWRRGPIPEAARPHLDPDESDRVDRTVDLPRPTSVHLWYTVRDRGSRAQPLAGGDLLLVAPSTGLLWLACWDS